MKNKLVFVSGMAAGYLLGPGQAGTATRNSK